MRRTFVAIQLPASVRGVLGELTDLMAPAWAPGAVRWVKTDSLHLTLRFLGDTAEETIPRLVEGLNTIVAHDQAFQVMLDSIGTFPGRGRPRVIWVGLADPDGRLAPLQKQVERLARSLGWQREQQRFTPHLTLGRVRPGATPPAGDWSPPAPGAAFTVDGLVLVESQLKPSGAEYAILHRASMQQQNERPE